MVLTTLGAAGALASGCTSDDNAAPGGSDAGSSSETGVNIDAPIAIFPGDSGAADAADATIPDGGQNEAGGNGDDAGGDSGLDSGLDSGPDSGLDSGLDANPLLDGGSDTGVDSGEDAGSTPLPDAKLVLVHAAPGLGPVRLCFGVSVGGNANTVANIPALPDGPSAPPYAPPPTGTGGTVAQGTPGFYPGTISAIPDITSLENLALAPFLIDATQIASNTVDGGPDGGVELGCPQLIGSHGAGPSDSPVAGILDPSAFWQLATIPAHTLHDGSTYLLSITGCVGGFTPSLYETGESITAQQVCGTDFPGDGGANVALGVTMLDTTTPVTGGNMGVQFAHRSTALEGAKESFNEGEAVSQHPPASNGVLPGFIIVGIDDAGPTSNFVQLAAAPVTTSGTQITPIQLTTVLDVTTTAVAGLTFPGSQPDGGPSLLPYPGSQTGAGDLIALSMNVTSALSNVGASTTQTPGGFGHGHAYTVVLLGINDPTLPQLADPSGDGGVNPAYDGRALHFVAFPNQFTPLVLQ